jgi:hypothetical protein
MMGLPRFENSVFYTVVINEDTVCTPHILYDPIALVALYLGMRS